MLNKKQNAAPKNVVVRFVVGNTASLATDEARKSYEGLFNKILKLRNDQVALVKEITKAALKPLVESKGQKDGCCAILDLLLKDTRYAVTRIRPEILKIARSVGLRVGKDENTELPKVKSFVMPNDCSTWAHVAKKIDAWQDVEKVRLLSDAEVKAKEEKEKEANKIDLRTNAGKEKVQTLLAPVLKAFEANGVPSLAMLIRVVVKHRAFFEQVYTDAKKSGELPNDDEE